MGYITVTVRRDERPVADQPNEDWSVVIFHRLSIRGPEALLAAPLSVVVVPPDPPHRLVDLKHSLRQVEPDRGNLRNDRPPLWTRADPPSHSDAVGRRSHQHCR